MRWDYFVLSCLGFVLWVAVLLGWIAGCTPTF